MALRLRSGLHGLRTIDARTGPFPEIQYAVNQSAVEIPSGSISGARLASIAPRLSLRICGPVQAGHRTETVNRRVKQSFTARAKLVLQLLRKVMQLSLVVSD